MIPRNRSTTKQDETNRVSSQRLNKAYLQTNKKYGYIKEIHEKNYAVSVLLEDGGLAGNGRFITITNPWQELIQNFGNLRPGLLVEVTYTGDQETAPSARVIGLEGERIGALQQAPEINLALYEIFSPGM